MSKILPANWNLPQIFHDRLGEEAGHQRIMDEEGHLLLVLHKVPDGDEELKRESVFFWQSQDGQWKSTNPGPGLGALDSHLESFLLAVTALDDACDKAGRASTYLEILTQGVPLRRTSSHLAHVLREARQARPSERKLILARDKAVAIERACDLLVEDARNGLDYLIAAKAEAQAEASESHARAGQKLNLLAAFFLPLTTIASLFGMNVPTGSSEFWAVVAGGLGVGVVALWIVNKSQHSRKKT